MDPLCSVFSITGSDTGSMNGDILVHPGDSASPLEVIEWLDRVDEKLDATSYGSVRRGDIPAKLLRETEPTDVDTVYPALRVGDGVDNNDVGRRTWPFCTASPWPTTSGASRDRVNHSSLEKKSRPAK